MAGSGNLKMYEQSKQIFLLLAARTNTMSSCPTSSEDVKTRWINFMFDGNMTEMSPQRVEYGNVCVHFTTLYFSLSRTVAVLQELLHTFVSFRNFRLAFVQFGTS